MWTQPIGHTCWGFWLWGWGWGEDGYNLYKIGGWGGVAAGDASHLASPILLPLLLGLLASVNPAVQQGDRLVSFLSGCPVRKRPPHVWQVPNLGVLLEAPCPGCTNQKPGPALEQRATGWGSSCRMQCATLAAAGVRLQCRREI